MLVRDGAVASVDVRGAAPGTRETDLLDPLNTVQKVHAIVLAGGSAFGLDAATGVMRWLESRHRLPGRARRACRSCPRPSCSTSASATRASVPMPPAAARRRRASAAAVPQGSVGAGAGATVGKLPEWRGP